MLETTTLDNQEKQNLNKFANLALQQDLNDEIEFKTLNGIAGRPLDLDEIRRERLKL